MGKLEGIVCAGELMINMTERQEGLTHGRSQPGLFSIGHSNHSLDHLVSLLKAHTIEVLVDVRSFPVSRIAPHFNQRPFQAALQRAGIIYLFLGEELGGRPQGEEYYDEAGHVLYSRLAESPRFLEGIERIERGGTKYRVALMCSEENPKHCHRRLLIGRVLEQRGTSLRHIRGDGQIEHEHDIVLKEAQAQIQSPQASFFDDDKVVEWKSIRSVLPGGRPPTSSER